MEFIPKYIRDEADYAPGYVVTADEFNGWLNRLGKEQGDNNTEAIVNLVNGWNNHDESINEHSYALEQHSIKLDTIQTGAQVNQDIRLAPLYFEGVNIGSITIDGIQTKFYAPVAGGIVQSDWEQTDSSSVDFIKNKPNISNGSGSGSIVEGRDSEADGNYSHAEGDYTEANGYASHAEGVLTKSNENSSHAEGQATIANGPYSHAEGYASIANGRRSHAEGLRTEASGEASHAEGHGSIANGSYSHAEGQVTAAIGGSSHAEGWSTSADGGSSHAEGYYSIARGERSHAEGWYTIASGQNSHVQGRYNIEDSTAYIKTSDVTIDSSKTYYKLLPYGRFDKVTSPVVSDISNYYEYTPGNAQQAFIIGNGTATFDRSNALTVDWQGKEWLADTLEVSRDPSSNMEVATKQYVDNLVASLRS